MNALQMALVNAGLANPKAVRKPKQKRITCKKCGEDMELEGNMAFCRKCSNYIFVGKKA